MAEGLKKAGKLDGKQTRRIISHDHNHSTRSGLSAQKGMGNNGGRLQQGRLFKRR